MSALVHIQGWMHGLLAARMTGFAAAKDWTLLAEMIPIGIAFGAIHALTPGHGKSVLASYLMSAPLSAFRSLLVADVQALTHVGIAVAIALVALPLVSRSLVGVGRTPALELVSRGLLVAIGLWLLLRVWRGYRHTRAEGEGIMVGVIAGLVPCPLTLFAMVMAVARGVPEAGLAFAAAMVLGVGFTLCVVALAATLARSRVIGFMTRHGRRFASFSRLMDGVSGALVLTIGLRELMA